MGNTKFTFQREYLDIINAIENAEVRREILEAVCNYALLGVEPENPCELLRVVMAAICPQIDAEKARAERSRQRAASKKKPAEPEQEPAAAAAPDETKFERIGREMVASGAPEWVEWRRQVGRRFGITDFGRAFEALRRVNRGRTRPFADISVEAFRSFFVLVAARGGI